jgi:hypothetical protein
MMWDTRPQYNKPAISRAATICDTRALESIEDVGLVMKASVGGFVFREVLTDSPNDRIAIESDLHSARDWYQEPIGLDEACFLLHIKTAKNSVRTDLKNPTFVKLAWDTAREIEETIFPQPPRVLSVADILGDECRC